MVLSNQREDLNAALATAEKDKKLLAANPLVQDNQKLVPSVTRVFRKDQNMFVYLEAYQPDADTTQPLVASVSFYRGKVKAFETAPLQITEGLNAKIESAAAALQRAAREAAARPLHLPGQRAGSARAEIRLLARAHRDGAIDTHAVVGRPILAAAGFQPAHPGNEDSPPSGKPPERRLRPGLAAPPVMRNPIATLLPR